MHKLCVTCATPDSVSYDDLTTCNGAYNLLREIPMKKKKKQAEDKLRLVKEIVRKQLGTVSGGRNCYVGTCGDITGTENVHGSCVPPP